jgi:Lar family restriction alleviation protein
MKMQNKLLECPFCGGEAKVLKNGAGCYEVYCCNCKSRQYAYAHETEEEAIEQWNTRKPMERIVEQLESLVEYNSEQAEIYHNVEKEDAYTREMKDLYIDRVNCYGVALRIVKGGVDNAG